MIGFYYQDILLKPIVWDYSGVYTELFFNVINKKVTTAQDLALFKAILFQNHLLNLHLGTVFSILILMLNPVNVSSTLWFAG